MIPFLYPLKESIWLRVAMLTLCTSLVSVVLWVVGTEYLEVNEIVVAVSVGIFCLVLSVLFGRVIANYATNATDFLSRAILLVARSDAQVEAPDENTLALPSRAFLQSLTASLYGLSTAAPAKPSSQHGSFFETLVATIALPVIVLNKQQQITYINGSALQYLALNAADVINKPVYDVLNLSFVSSLTLESWLTDVNTSRVTATEVWERVRHTFADETRKQFDMAAHFSKDDANGIETTLALFDRTRHYERDDHDLTFVALAVHELRTPLTIMRGYIEVFEDEISQTLNPEQTAFMHNMSASAQQLTAFVANILNVARVEENALTVRLKEENWSEVLVGACRDMELRASVHNKKLVYKIAENMPTAAVDKVSIYEVLNNLLDNAVKYTHTDEDIVIETFEKDGFIETTVTDKGVGIPDSLIAHVFDKFYRAHQSKNSVGGTGLGLFLSRSIIAAHGGTIWVKSKEGEGSTFGFTLPIYANVADQIKTDDNGEIIRGAHGWIKNHSYYRG
jgi:signal transduction histidine kinase